MSESGSFLNLEGLELWSMTMNEACWQQLSLTRKYPGFDLLEMQWVGSPNKPDRAL